MFSTSFDFTLAGSRSHSTQGKGVPGLGDGKISCLCSSQASDKGEVILMKDKLNRRRFLREGIYAGAALGLGLGCAKETPEGLLVPAERRFAKPNVSWDRIIRTSVGLRPARRSGPRVEAEKLGEKMIIHNYGHGSRGVTLCWGTSHIAVEEAQATGQTQFGVIGCGSVGLATARLLQEKGHKVTIYARDLPPNTTSDHAEAIWDGGDDPDPSEAWIQAARLSHGYFTNLVGDRHGVRWIEYYSEDYEDMFLSHYSGSPLGDLYKDFRLFERNELPFPFPTTVMGWRTMLIEPPVYMKAVVEDFLSARGTIVVREFSGLEDVLKLPEPVIMNCSGLGAKFLFDDEEMFPIKGQLTILLPQPEIDYCIDSPGIIPRRDGLLLAGTYEPNVWSLEPNMEAMREYMNRHMAFTNSMR
jgi:hypothetical protein